MTVIAMDTAPEGVQLIMVQNEKGKKEEEELLKFPFEIDFLDA